MARFDTSVSWTIAEHIFNFILSDAVLDGQLLYHAGSQMKSSISMKATLMWCA